MEALLVAITYNRCYIFSMKEINFCETEVRIHPELGIQVRADGAILTRNGWTFGTRVSNGYLHVCVRGKGYQVHRLVAQTFIPNPDNKPTVDHINRKRDDNRVINLRWATHREQRDNSQQVLEAKDLGVRCCDNPKEYSRRNARLYYAEKRKDPEWVAKEKERLKAYAKSERGRAKAKERQRRYRERKKARSTEQAS